MSTDVTQVKNINRDYLVTVDVKNSGVTVGNLKFFITDEKTSNIYVQLLINMSSNELIKDLVILESASDYELELRIVKPNNEPKRIKGKLLNEYKALFLFDLEDDCKDIIGPYKCELLISCKVENRTESITSDSFTYVVNQSILNELDDIINKDEKYPIVLKLIDEIKQLQGGDLTDYQKKEDAAQKTIVEDGKLYLAKLDGTKLDDGTTLPTGSGTSIDDTNTTIDKTWSSSKIDSQFKDIENLSLTKHTDGKVYIKKQDGTLLGTGIEIGGSDVDLSKITMSMSGQTLKLMNGGTQVATVEIPTAVVTDEQLTSIIQSKIDDGTLTNMTITDNSITPQKTDFFNVTDNTNSVIETTWGDGGYLAKKSDYLEPLDEMYLCVDAPSGGGNEVQILFYDSSKTLISTYTSDDDFYAKYRETIFTGGSSGNDSKARKVTFKLPIKELKPEGTSYIAIISRLLKTDDTPQLKTTLNNKPGKYISLNEKYNNDLIKNIDISNTNFKTISNNSLLNYKKVATNSTDFPGNNVLYFVDYIDTSVNKEIYIRFATNGSTQITSFSDVALYDENKQYIKTVYANPGSDTSKEKANFAVVYNDMALEPNKELENGEKVKTIEILKLIVPDEAKYIRFGNIDLYIRQFAKLWNFLYVSYKSITNVYRMTDSYNVEINIDFKKLVNECIDAKTEKTMVCIGDSLTDWGGGNDSSSGFLKVVHDKTGVMTDNRGKAGAWWQIQNNDESLTGTSAVNRVDYIVHNNEKFDLYCFIMGSNAGSSTDTGETSSNKTTMCGAIRYCMEKLKAHDPTAQILVCLPPQRAEGNDGQLLVNEVIKKIVEDEYSVRTLDLYRHSGVVPNTTIADINYLSDGLHLGSNGQTAIGNVLASEVKYMLCL